MCVFKTYQETRMNYQTKEHKMNKRNPNTRSEYMKAWRRKRRSEGWQDIHQFGPADLISKLKETVIKWKIDNAEQWIKR